MKLGTLLALHTRAAWRAWLKRHHAKAKEIWLVYYKKASGRLRVSYNDAVDEALCFGWIDSTVKALDQRRYAQRFTPRRPGSPASELNKARARRMIRERRMTRAGLEALGWTTPGSSRPAPLKTAPDIARALKATPPAWQNFRGFSQAYQRIRLAFVEGARGRPEIFRTRLRYLVRMSAQGKRFGMVLG